MNIRFIDRSGKERVTDGLADLIVAVKEGELSSETLVFDGIDLRWKKASEIAELGAVTSDPQMLVTSANTSATGEDPIRNPEFHGSLPVVRSPIADTESPADHDAGQSRPESVGNVVPNVNDTTIQRSSIVTWARVSSGPVIYSVTLGLSYGLFQTSHLVKNASMALAIDVVSIVGAITSGGGLLRRTKTVTSLEWVVVALVVLTIPASLRGVVLAGRRQMAVVAKASSEIRVLRQTMVAAVKASGINDVPQMLDGEKSFDISTIASARSHTDGLIVLLDTTIASTDAALKESKSGLSETDPTLGYLLNVGQKMNMGYSVNREYFEEIRRVLDLLMSKNGSYDITAQGPQFRAKTDADAFYASGKRIADYERQLTAITTAIRNVTPPEGFH